MIAVSQMTLTTRIRFARYSHMAIGASVITVSNSTNAVQRVAARYVSRVRGAQRLSSTTVTYAAPKIICGATTRSKNRIVRAVAIVMGRLNRSSQAPAREPARCADGASLDAVLAALTSVRG